MLRAASTTVAKRAFINSSRAGIARCPATMTFHASSRREEEAKTTEHAPSKGGLFGTGLSEWFALPIGVTAAVPIIHFEWYVVNEETQLAAVFLAFCVACYTQGGDAIYNSLNEKVQAMLKEHNEAEDKVIAALEQKRDFLMANQNMVNDFESINKLREESYTKLNAAGAVKPTHDFKAQVERALNMIVQEEANVTEKTKVALMEEATGFVKEQFTSSKELKKAALTAAISQIKGTAKDGSSDPVRETFIQFFKQKAETLSKADDGSEEKTQREALIAKLNAVAKSEGFFFEFGADGKPKAMSSVVA